jgi:hypothetical protein
MTNDTPTGADGDAPEEPRPSFRSALRGLRRAASEVAETGAEEARKLAEAARPEVERRARQARAAAEAARPHIEGKAREATDYVREHQDDIVRASKRGAEVAASTVARTVTPGPLRPAVDAMERELRATPNAANPSAPDADASSSKPPEPSADAPAGDAAPGDASRAD